VVIPLKLHISRNLEESLQQFTKVIFMTGDNQWMTEDNRLIDVKIFNKIKVAPPVLFFHLQRFSFDFKTKTKKNLNLIFDFPFEFVLSPYMISSNAPNMYELIGIANHSGNSFGGHYVSYIRTSENQWKEFNDSFVSDIHKDDIKMKNGAVNQRGYNYQSSSNAYVLLCQHKSRSHSKLPFNSSESLISLSLLELKQTSEIQYIEQLIAVIQIQPKFSVLISNEAQLFSLLHISFHDWPYINSLRQLFLFLSIMFLIKKKSNF
jgi:hypothetical protein